MQNLKEYIASSDKKSLKDNFIFYIFSGFFAFALFNPFFQKYDYGAGLPVVMLFSFVLLAIFISEFFEKREKGYIEKVFILIFAVTYILAFYFSQTKNLSFPETLAYLSVLPFYIFFAHKKLIFRDKLLKTLGVFGFLSVSLGFVLYFLLDPTRMTGPFFNVLYHANFWPNAFGTFLLMIWPVYLWIYRGRWNFMAILTFSFVLSGLLLTFSRGALIAFFGQVILLALFNLRKIKLRVIGISLLVALLSFSFFWFSNFARGLSHITIDVGERISFQNNEILTSGQERTDFWKGAIELIQEKPLTGYGPFSFRYAFNPIQKIFLGASDHPHNLFLKLGAENGIINMIAFFGLFFTVFLLFVFRFKKLSNEDRAFSIVPFVAVAGSLAHSLIDYNYNFFQNLLLLFLMLALLRSSVIIAEPRPKKAIFAGAFSVFVLFVCLYQGAIIFLSGTGFMANADKYSLYVRYKYLDEADAFLNEGKLSEAMDSVEKNLSYNPLDSKAYYLKGVILCDKNYSDYDIDACKEAFGKALTLNPKNDVNYYREYLRVLEQTKSEELTEFRVKCLDLFNLYFGYTKYNMHFTAYTPQVEVAADIADMLIPYLDPEKAKTIREKKVLMLQFAKEHRGGKTF